jgi:hypothetical protein
MTYLGRDFNSDENWDFDLDELVEQTLKLMTWVREHELENPEKLSILNERLLEYQRIKDKVEWALISLCNRLSSKRIKCSEDILKMFEETGAREILEFNYINIQQTGINAYFN